MKSMIKKSLALGVAFGGKGVRRTGKGLPSFLTGILGVFFLMTACTGMNIPEAANSGLGKAENLRYSADGRTVKLRWDVADPSAVDGVQITCNGENPVKIDSLVTEYVVRHVVPNKDVYYTVKLHYTNKLVSEGVTICVHLRYDAPIYYGFVLAADAPENLPDDDERAAALWFRDNYVNQGLGQFVSIGQIQSIDLDAISTLWIHVDRTGMRVGAQNLTGGFGTALFIESLRHFVEEGGNVLLTNHATQLVSAIGRIDEEYAVNEFNSGDGGTGDDIWTMNAFLGQTYDHRGDVYFRDMILGDYNGYEYTSFPMLGPGLREDHNSMWNLSAKKFIGAIDKVRGFEQATHCTALATWGQNTEMSFIGMCDFAPSGAYHGRIVAIGLGCYEWAQSGEGNIFQSQIERLTSNCLRYLHD